MESERANPGRILVVDDEPLNRALVEALLAPEGYRVLQAETGTAALDLLSREPVDLVLLDVLMPGIDGFETCRRIRREHGDGHLPVVIVTALADRASRLLGLEAGADDFLAKPIDEPTLLVRVRNLLQVKAFHDLRRRQAEQAELELERLRVQLLRADRLATLGTLAAGVGHELANLAMVQESAVAMVQAQAEAGLPVEPEDLSALQDVARHLGHHARRLRELGRGGEAGEPAEIGQVVSAALEMLRITGRTRHLRIERSLPDVPATLRCSRAGLEQVLLNLVANAADALAEAGRDPALVRIELSLDAAAGIALLRVSDNGPGLPPGQEEAVFEPWFTTKPPGRGTGLGLAVVRQVVTEAGGSLSVRSVPGEGCAFSLRLPLA